MFISFIVLELVVIIYIAICDCFLLNSIIQRNKQIDELDVWGRVLDGRDVKDICDKIFYSGYAIKEKVKATLWKNILGVYHPSMASQEDRLAYFTKLHHVYEKLKKKWVDQRKNDRTIRRLCDTVKRDAQRTDVNEEFYRGPANQNVKKLVNIIVTYVQEHPNVSYTQGMTDMLSPILYVMNDEADAYICFSCLLQPIQDNFTAQCEGALNKIKALKHLCEVLAPDLYHYLEELDQDAFTLCFGMVLIECRREFSFEDSINLLEVIIASRFGYRLMTHDLSQVDWANYMTTDSRDILEEAMAAEGSLSSIAHSVNSNYTDDSYADHVMSSASYTSQPKDTSGYHVIRSSSNTPQLNTGRLSGELRASPVGNGRRSLDHPSAEFRASPRSLNVVHSLDNTPVPPESGLDSSTEGNVLTPYPIQQYVSGSEDGMTPVRFFDNPQETALELSSGHSSRASSLRPSSVLGDPLPPDLTQTKFEISFPLFISLAALLTHQQLILNDQIDFIGISGLLNDNMGTLELKACLDQAKWLKQRYHILQQERFGFKSESFSKWLIEPCNDQI